MGCARWRENIKLPKRHGNWIDPLIIDPVMHDVYPKQDLIGGYIGDGSPLRAAVETSDALLTKGARYADRPSLDDAPVMPLEEESDLFMELCGASTGVACRGKAFVTVAKSLTCTGVECSANKVKYVRVAR